MLMVAQFQFLPSTHSQLWHQEELIRELLAAVSVFAAKKLP